MRQRRNVQNNIRARSQRLPDGAAPPVSAGEPTARVMLIGQAPSRTDEATGRMFSGPGGKRLRAWLKEAEIDESDLYLSALTQRYPGRAANGKGDRAPSRKEINEDRPRLLAEVETLQPELVLLVGGMAIREFLGNGTLAEFVGRTFPANVTPFSSLLKNPNAVRIVPLPHCSGASLWLNRPEHQELLTRALGEIRALRSDDER